jgi:ribonuclease J
MRVVSLGGLGDVGRNMAVIEFDSQLLLVDCGVLFPEDDHPGVDLILPGFDALTERLGDVIGLVLTHGHEDHIGAVPYLLRQRPDIPLIGSKLTLALLAEKLREHQLRNVQQRVVTDGDKITIGKFECEFIAVNHSIPDALAVAVRTSAGLILHTGDFKMDQLPLDGRVT